MKTDEEIIADFMRANGGDRLWGGKFIRRILNLDTLHLVEEKLTEDQWEAYEETLEGEYWACERFLIHLSAEQKIKALATVLRPPVILHDPSL